MRVGDYVKVLVVYPKDPRLCGVHEGIVQKIGQFKNGYVYFRLQGSKLSLPLSSKYTRILERR